MKLDHDRKITQVFGRQPLRYLQDGHGFDGAERYLGRFNAQGETLDDTKGEGEAGDGVMSGRPADGHIRPKVGEEQPSGAASLDELGVKELKAIAKEAGIEGASTMNKAALVEAITEATEPGGNGDDAQGEGEGEGAA